MKTITTGILLLAAFGAQAGESPVPCAADQDAFEIAQSYGGKWQSALQSADPSRIGNLYGDTAVLMPPSDETVVGKAVIASYLLGERPLGANVQGSVDYVSCRRQGDTLHVAGVWGAPTAPAEGNWQTGNFLRVLERTDDGTWRAQYEIWN